MAARYRNRTFGLAMALPLALIAIIGVRTSRADEGTTAEQIVAAMKTLWGSQEGFRANHAKGVVVTGSFVATPQGPGLSKASLFDGEPVPVTVRFSDSTGLPKIPDGADLANPHGMSMKFVLADGVEMDVVTNPLAFFPVATGEEFLALLTAIAQTKPEAQKPTPVERFMAEHPAAPKAFASVQTPSSFARETYHGVDAFLFVDAGGKRQPFRFRFVPAASPDYLFPDDAAKRGPNYLRAELPAALATAPVVFTIQAQLANPGDQTRDPSQPWPEDRKVVTLGTITLDRAVADSAAAEKALVFLPSNLADGIEVSDDPLIDARNQAYAVSFGKRLQ